MPIARLELGEVETTEYTDLASGKKVRLKFRHCTPGEEAEAMKEAGISFLPDGTVKTTGDDDGLLQSTLALEAANIIVAKKCIEDCRFADDDKVVRHSSIPRHHLVKIGAYVRDKASLSASEKKA